MASNQGQAGYRWRVLTGQTTPERFPGRAGHGAGKPTLKALEETADAYAFMAQALGMEGKP